MPRQASPCAARITSVADEVELEDVYEAERQLFYVACTRARGSPADSGPFLCFAAWAVSRLNPSGRSVVRSRGRAPSADLCRRYLSALTLAGI